MIRFVCVILILFIFLIAISLTRSYQINPKMGGKGIFEQIERDPATRNNINNFGLSNNTELIKGLDLLDEPIGRTYTPSHMRKVKHDSIEYFYLNLTVQSVGSHITNDMVLFVGNGRNGSTYFVEMDYFGSRRVFCIKLYVDQAFTLRSGEARNRNVRMGISRESVKNYFRQNSVSRDYEFTKIAFEKNMNFTVQQVCSLQRTDLVFDLLGNENNTIIPANIRQQIDTKEFLRDVYLQQEVPYDEYYSDGSRLTNIYVEAAALNRYYFDLNNIHALIIMPVYGKMLSELDLTKHERMAFYIDIIVECLKAGINPYGMHKDNVMTDSVGYFEKLIFVDTGKSEYINLNDYPGDSKRGLIQDIVLRELQIADNTWEFYTDREFLLVEICNKCIDKQMEYIQNHQGIACAREVLSQYMVKYGARVDDDRIHEFEYFRDEDAI